MQPTSLYLFFWTLGCAIGLVAALLVLRRRGVLGPAATFAVAVAWLTLVVGSKWHSRLEYLPWTSALLVSPTELFAPGRRLPLGLLASGVAAALCCLALRLPWRAVGDAVAVFWSVLIPVGRIGCMAYGCCVGIPCGARLAPLCWRYGPRSEAFHWQLDAGLVEPASLLSLPTHPLPLYFAVASLGTLGVLAWLLRRTAPPGTLLLAFCILRPATKLALEPLRAEPAPPWLMLGIPTATLAIAIVVALRLLLRRLRVVRRRRLATAFLLPLVLVALSTPAARPEEPPWRKSLAAYARDPLRSRRLIQRLEREGGAGDSPVLLLALADARLRSGHFAAAERTFARVVAGWPDAALAGWAAQGRAWARILSGEERRFSRVVDAAHPSSALPGATRLVEAYARYWTHDDAGAIAAFDAAADAADGALVDDARYGAARARLRAGDAVGALPILHDLATWHANGPSAAPSPALVALDREAVLRAGFDRYRRGALQSPEQHLRQILDGDGTALARAALHELESVHEQRSLPVATGIGARATPAALRASHRRVAASRSPTSLDMVAAWSRRLLAIVGVAAGLLIAHTWWRDRPAPPGAAHGPRTG